MKQVNWRKWMQVSVFFMLIIALCSCSQVYKDEEIKKDLTSKAKENKAFLGVRFIVNDGIVSLSGECPTEQAKTKVESTVKGVYAVKSVINNITIDPVVIGTDQQLKQSVDSTLKSYPGVTAIVKDSIVQLLGTAQNKDQRKLLSAIQSLQPKRLESEITFK